MGSVWLWYIGCRWLFEQDDMITYYLMTNLNLLLQSGQPLRQGLALPGNSDRFGGADAIGAE